MNNQKKLYSEGMRPVVTINGRSSVIPRSCSFNLNEKTGEFKISFEYIFKKPEETFFSFSFPYSYTKCQEKLSYLTGLFKTHKSIYFHRDLIIKSNKGLRVDLLTISSKKNITSEREVIGEKEKTGIFPEVTSERSFTFSSTKKTIFISARIHPGESISSYILDGIIQFLLHKTDPRSISLRNYFVFKIIPILNPDGVFYGHYRSDMFGVNLNRQFSSCTIEKHPSIYATKNYVVHLSKTQNLSMYIDLHAHSTVRGCFLYGNSYDSYDKQLNNILFAKLISINTQHFDFRKCCFSERNMKRVDKKGKSKEGTGRVCLNKLTGVNCYTIECNYNSGRSVNKIPEFPRNNKKEALFCTRIQNFITPPTYTSQIFRDIGQAIALGILDYYEKNMFSRIRSLKYRNMHLLKTYLKTEMDVRKKFWKHAKKEFIDEKGNKYKHRKVKSLEKIRVSEKGNDECKNKKNLSDTQKEGNGKISPTEKKKKVIAKTRKNSFNSRTTMKNIYLRKRRNSNVVRVKNRSSSTLRPVRLGKRDLASIENKRNKTNNRKNFVRKNFRKKITDITIKKRTKKRRSLRIHKEKRNPFLKNGKSESEKKRRKCKSKEFRTDFYSRLSSNRERIYREDVAKSFSITLAKERKVLDKKRLKVPKRKKSKEKNSVNCSTFQKKEIEVEALKLPKIFKEKNNGSNIIINVNTTISEAKNETLEKQINEKNEEKSEKKDLNLENCKMVVRNALKNRKNKSSSLVCICT